MSHVINIRNKFWLLLYILCNTFSLVHTLFVLLLENDGNNFTEINSLHSSRVGVWRRNDVTQLQCTR